MAYDMLSSPDPLALSNENISTPSPTKSKGVVLTPRKVLADTSGNTHVQDFFLNTPPPRRTSPTKSLKQSSQSTSPWRIRLTLQAEQTSDLQGSPPRKRSPTKRLIERSTTITVPLNGGDDTPQFAEKRGRGRPRKSLEAPVKKNGTPIPKKNARRKTVPDVVQEQDDTPVSLRATPPKRAKGRPRKSLEFAKDISTSMQGDTPLYSPVMEEVKRDGAEKFTRRKSRTRRKEIIPVEIAMETGQERPHSSKKLNGSVNEARSLTADNDMGSFHFGSGEKSALHPDVPQRLDPATRPRSSPSPGHSSVEDDPDGMWRAMSSCKTPLPNEDDNGEADFDPTNEHQEYDTILESEGFSMVSVSSLASTGSRSRGSAEKVEEYKPYEQESTAPASHSVPATLIDIQIQQEPLQNLRARESTPSVAASPSIPQAPKNAPSRSPRAMQEPTDGTPKLTRVVRAGNALQGVLSPKPQNLASSFRPAERVQSPLMTEDAAAQTVQSAPVAIAKSSKDNLENLFSGFGAGTRRELKAGLRLGEELAKRQQLNCHNPVPSPVQSADVVSSAYSDPLYPSLSSADNTISYNLPAPGPVREVQYPVLSNPQLPSPKLSEEDLDEDRMSWEADAPVKINKPTAAEEQSPGQKISHLHRINSPETPSAGLAAPDTSGIDHVMLAREAEWQREREAVSRQIEMANKSQVIVIDDTSEIRHMSDEDEEDSDVWQAEANESREPTPEVSKVVERPEIVKPRRMQLPSPWRRNSQVAYSDGSESTKTNLFWKPDESKSERTTQENTHSGCRPESSNEPVSEQQRYHVHGTEDKMSRSDSSKAQSLEVPASAGNCHTLARHVNPGPVELPKTPEKTYVEDYTESFDGNMSLTPIYDRTVDAFSPVEITAPIDPLLLQKPAHKDLQKRPQSPPDPINPIVQSQQSWLSRLTAPIWRAFTPLPPPATKEDILSSGPYEPLCQFTPWEGCHSRALSPLYYASLLYGSHIFPCDKTVDSCVYHGMKIVTPLGWSRYVTPADCGVVSAFMILLDERGFALSEPGERWIDDFIVFHQIVNLWVSMVMKGEVEIDESKGEKSGLRLQGDRKWTKDDIDWSKNRTEYFERKKRQFDGLPSWKAKGLKYVTA